MRLGIVNEISSAILGASAFNKFALEAVAEAALRRLSALVPFFSSSVAEYNCESGAAALIARVSGCEAPETLGDFCSLDELSHAETLLKGEVFYCCDLAEAGNCSAVQEALYEWGVRSYLLVPVIAGGQMLGTLNIMRERPHAFSEGDFSVLKEVADFLALAFQHARDRVALEAAKKEAEEKGRFKSAFLANMSHEIRTPLTAIQGYAEVLTDLVGGKARALLQRIRLSGDRLERTLTSVLDLLALENRSKEVSRQPIDVRRAAEKAVRLLKPKAQAKGLLTRIEAPPEPAWALADPDALARVLTNLVSNAVKFTDKGWVTLRVMPCKETVRIEVEDTGVGIDPAFMPHVFDEFRQESQGMARCYEGLGLGLSVTKRLVELMGGEIEVTSQKGRGSTFIVNLPTPENGSAFR